MNKQILTVYDEVFGPMKPQPAPASVIKYDDNDEQDPATLNVQISGILIMLSVIATACVCMYVCCCSTFIQQNRRNLLALMATYAVFVVVVAMRRFC